MSEVLEAYAGWVAKVQQKDDPNGIDVRVEPKFTIPDGNPYTGGWCRWPPPPCSILQATDGRTSAEGHGTLQVGPADGQEEQVS